MENQENEDLQQDELTNLKARADRLGVKYHPSLTDVEKLRAKINAHTAGQPDPDNETNMPKPTVAKVDETPGQKRKRQKDEALKLIRVVVSCNNPAKRDWQGEIFTVGNATVGTVKKFVPFNAEEGWYIPQIMLNMIKERNCQIFVRGRAKNGVETSQSKIIKEFNVEILPQLTHDELKELARRQAMAAGAD